MGRKSLEQTRRAEILAAFERCIERYGIDVPLEQIADEAGVKRSLIRHYLGNRDEVVNQMIDRIAREYPAQMMAQMERAASDGEAGILTFFFSEDYPATAWDHILGAVASAAHDRYPQAKQRLGQMLLQMIADAAGILAKCYPHATTAQCEVVAYGLFSLAYAHDSIAMLLPQPADRLVARLNAQLLLQTLGAPDATTASHPPESGYSKA
jgi:AcrR family transcriptional regulator